MSRRFNIKINNRRLKDQIKAGWTQLLSLVIGKFQLVMVCRIHYRMFAQDQYHFSIHDLPMKGG